MWSASQVSKFPVAANPNKVGSVTCNYNELVALFGTPIECERNIYSDEDTEYVYRWQVCFVSDNIERTFCIINGVFNRVPVKEKVWSVYGDQQALELTNQFLEGL